MKYSLSLLSVFLALPVFAASPAQHEADARAALALASVTEEPAVIRDVSMLELIASYIGAAPQQVTRTLLQSGDDIILQECNGQNCTQRKIGTISGLLATTPVTADAKAAKALASPCPCICGCGQTGICTCSKIASVQASAPMAYAAPSQACATCGANTTTGYYSSPTAYGDMAYTDNSGSCGASGGGPRMPIRHVIGRRLFPNMASRRGW